MPVQCRLLGSAVLLLFAACGDSQGPTAIVPCSDDQEVGVTVSPGLQPLFSWEPACGMTSVHVFAASHTTGGTGWVIWGGQQAAENPFGSGIRYGRAPAGAFEPASAAPLVAGEDYTVQVFRWIGEPGGPGGPFERGLATFRP